MYPLHNLACHLVPSMLPCQGHHHSQECRDILLSKMVLSGRSEVLSLAMQDRILGSQIMERHPLHLPQHQPPRRGLILILFQARFRLSRMIKQTREVNLLLQGSEVKPHLLSPPNSKLEIKGMRVHATSVVQPTTCPAMPTWRNSPRCPWLLSLNPWPLCLQMSHHHISWIMEKVVPSAVIAVRPICARTCSLLKVAVVSSVASAAVSQRCLPITSSIWITQGRGWTATTDRSSQWAVMSLWLLWTTVRTTRFLNRQPTSS